VGKNGKKLTKTLKNQALENYQRFQREISQQALAAVNKARENGDPPITVANVINPFPYSQNEYLSSHREHVSTSLRNIESLKLAIGIAKTEEDKQKAIAQFQTAIEALTNQSNVEKKRRVKEWANARKTRNRRIIDNSSKLAEEAAVVEEKELTEKTQLKFNTLLQEYRKTTVKLLNPTMTAANRATLQSERDRLKADLDKVKEEYRIADQLEHDYSRKALLAGLPVEKAQGRLNAEVASTAAAQKITNKIAANKQRKAQIEKEAENRLKAKAAASMPGGRRTRRHTHRSYKRVHRSNKQRKQRNRSHRRRTHR